MPKKQKFPHLVGSKWTAAQETWGWRHFRVVNRKTEGSWVFAEMVAACDPSVRFWLSAQQLKEPMLWQAGWQPLRTFNAMYNVAEPPHHSAEPDSTERSPNVSRRRRIGG